MPSELATPDGTLAYDDHGGSGRLMVLLPGAGDVRSEHRFLAATMATNGFRVVTVDLRGHGASSPDWPTYGVAATAMDIIEIVQHLDAGPATIVANSFAPAAALWAAAERPELISSVVAISPHLDQDAGRGQRLALQVALRGPFAGFVWEKFYRSWYKSNPPADLDEQTALLRVMMRDAGRRRAVRTTLLAHRNGLDAQLARLELPVLAIFGSADDHFADPREAAADAAARTNGSWRLVDGAGHYPHVEYPEIVAEMILEFMAQR